jgi:hypothetical protein
MYNKVILMLIKKGYKPLNNIKITFSLECKQTKYPYTLSIKQKNKTNNTTRKIFYSCIN